MADDRVVLHSYRRVFEVDRRIYRVDRWAVPVPGGVPLSGIWWFLMAEVVVVILSFVPGIGVLPNGEPGLMRVLPWPLVYLIIPTLVAVFATQATPDGRPAHRFALDWLRLRARAPRHCGDLEVPVEGETRKWSRRLRIHWDADAPRLQRVRIRGPVRVRLNVPVRTSGSWRGGVIIRPHPGGEPKDLDVESGRVMEVRP